MNPSFERIYSEDTPRLVTLLLTIHGAQQDVVNTVRGPVRWDRWLALERDRRKDGLPTEIVRNPKTGELALAVVRPDILATAKPISP